jgi:hypothetical protein
MNKEITPEEAVETVIQGLRQLKLDQVRRQLEHDLALNSDRFAALVAFVIDAQQQ